MRPGPDIKLGLSKNITCKILTALALLCCGCIIAGVYIIHRTSTCRLNNIDKARTRNADV